ncbi:MsnO8 family LLM class oxidoreductase [Streptomyces sp. Q6]|uniref:MsnO8 family LLM class oxidoreductase n=1 Tax=Streptomyces citrinus TaxID=3118173 RepID=A0ACD5AIU8_9ACTN
MNDFGPLRLSVLDQSPIGEGRTPDDALHTTLELARLADSLGYHRYWLAEHHNSRSFAGTSPEVLAGPVLQHTSRVRVGTGGILLPRYHPDTVAEKMNLLRRLSPGRVDVGIARGGGPADDFDQKLLRLRQHLMDEGPADPPVPSTPAEPENGLWLLGAGGSTAPLAGRLGAGYAFGHFFSPRNGPASLAAYRRHLPDGRQPSPLLAVRVIAAEDPEKAAALAQAMLLWRARKDLGHDGPVPGLHTLAQHTWTSEERTQAALHRSAVLHGTPDQLHHRLTALAHAHQVSEIMINTVTAAPEHRMTSYKLLADAVLAPLAQVTVT